MIITQNKHLSSSLIYITFNTVFTFRVISKSLSYQISEKIFIKAQGVQKNPNYFMWRLREPLIHMK